MTLLLLLGNTPPFVLEKKAEEEKAAERRAERKEHMEKLMEGTYKVSAISTDMNSSFPFLMPLPAFLFLR